jgi:hypothetical protein
LYTNLRKWKTCRGCENYTVKRQRGVRWSWGYWTGLAAAWL